MQATGTGTKSLAAADASSVSSGTGCVSRSQMARVTGAGGLAGAVADESGTRGDFV